MAELYGAIAIPLEASQDGEDPLLSYTLGYFRAIANAYAKAEWGVVAAGEPGPVVGTFDAEPHMVQLAEKDLPALFLWRPEMTERKQVAESIKVEIGRLSLMWVPSATTADKQLGRRNFPSKLYKLLDDYLDRGRDKAWVVAGDTYANAPAYGSVLATFAKFRRLWMTGRMVATPLIYENEDGSKLAAFEAYTQTLYCEEQLVPEAASRARPLVGIDQTVSVAPGDPLGPFVTNTAQLR